MTAQGTRQISDSAAFCRINAAFRLALERPIEATKFCSSPCI
jgi:hypothetical protein